MTTAINMDNSKTANDNVNVLFDHYLLIPLMCVHQCEEQVPVPLGLFHDIHYSVARHQLLSNLQV
jgi:hypothetical protein